jgi:hypothetical protein
MDPILSAALGVLAILLLSGLWWSRQRRHTDAIAGHPPTHAMTAPPGQLATSLVLGTSADKAALVVSMSSDELAFSQGRSLSNGRNDLVERMSASLQAAPSLLVQQAHQGRHLMEVVINNPLANSAKGDYFQPFARGADGKIIEQAKLADPSGLSSLVNAAAVWQVASVVVAQKHLADISEKLDRIKQGIDDLKNLFYDKLEGDIEGIYRYLRGVARSFEYGVPKFARIELEPCRRKLLEMESGLIRMFNRRLAQAIEHKESMGTGSLLQDTLERYDELERIRSTLLTCLQAEALAWQVLSLFPGEEANGELWKEETLESMAKVASLQARVVETGDADVARFQAFWNWESTLEARRTEVRKRAQDAALSLQQTASAFQATVDNIALMLEHNNDPIRLGLEVVNGHIQQVRVLA